MTVLSKKPIQRSEGAFLLLGPFPADLPRLCSFPVFRFVSGSYPSLLSESRINLIKRMERMSRWELEDALGIGVRVPVGRG
jgi:hypothetical protein